MKCWNCDNNARAVCIFCGRFVCEEHAKTKRHFAGFGTKYSAQIPSSETATEVSDAIWCGECRIEYISTK